MGVNTENDKIQPITFNDVWTNIKKLICLSDITSTSLLQQILDTCTYFDDDIQLNMKYPIEDSVIKIIMSRYSLEIKISEDRPIRDTIFYSISDINLIDTTLSTNRKYNIEELIKSQIEILTTEIDELNNIQQELNDRQLYLKSNTKGE